MKKRLRLLAFIGVVMMVVSMCACQGMPSGTTTSSAKSTTASTASSAVTTTNSTATTTTTTVFLKPSITDTPTDADNAAKYVKEPSLPAAYNKSTHSAMYATPSSRYRIHYLRHDAQTVIAPTPQEYRAQGVGGVVLNDTMNERYLQYAPVLRNLSKLIQRIKDNGMNVWIYDEHTFPSGAAGGLVLENNPEYQSQGVSCLSQTGNGKSAVTWEMPELFESVVSAYAVDSNGETHKAKVSGTTVTFGGVQGDWTLYMIVMSRMHEQTVASHSGAFRKLPNLLDKRAVAKFIEYTHAYYAKYIQNFGDNITAFFTDEPNTCEAILLGTIPHAKISWCEELEDRFKAKWGYDIATNYHSLFAGDSYKDQQVRTNYREIVGELFAENYTGQISEYLAQYGILSSGHLTLEENIVNHVANYGNYMRALSGMSAPGVDVCIGGYTAYMNEILGDWTVTNHFMSAKYGGSVGRLKNSDLVMVEFCPIETEDGKFQSKNDQYAITNNVFFSGINHINSYSQNWNMVENGVNYSADYADYTARMSYMLRNSEFDTRLGVYYPIETMQANFEGMTMHLQDQMSGARGTKMQKTLMALTKAIWSNQMEHTFIDADSILNAKIQGKALVFNGFAVECLIMPRTEVLSVKVAKKLNDWKKVGGKVIWLEEKAYISTEIGKETELQALLADAEVILSVNEVVSQARAQLDDALKITTTDTKELYVSRHKLQDATMYFLINNSDKANKLELSYEGAKGFDIYDNETGRIITLSGSSVTVEVPAYRSVFAVINQ